MSERQPYAYGLDHGPIDLYEAGRLLMDGPARHVRATYVGEAFVSTVFLVFDHSFGFGGAPVLYETMVIGGPLADDGERYTTREAAEAGHDRWVAAARDAAALDMETETLDVETEARDA
jgi:hypothetical protein